MTQNDDNSVAGQIDDRIQSSLKGKITEHLQVKDKSGEHVGTVDGMEGERIKLTRTDSPDGQHHYLNLSDVESADDVAVYLNKSRDELEMATQ